MNISIDYLKNKGFNCESIREKYKGDFKITLNRYGEYHYQFKEFYICLIQLNKFQQWENH